MSEEALKLEKIKNSCNVTAKVALVLEILLSVIAFISLVCVFVCARFQDDIDQTMGEQVAIDMQEDMVQSFQSIGGLFRIVINSGEMIENGHFGMLLALYCLSATILLVMVVIVIDLIRKIFKTIKISETPFSEEVLKKLRRMFIVIAIVLLLMSGVGMALMVGLIGWCIYTILDYGFTLQKQVDEML